MLKSLFKLTTDKFILSTTETSETSSAKSLAFVERPSGDRLYRSKNNGLRIDPCDTPFPYWTMKRIDHFALVFVF